MNNEMTIVIFMLIISFITALIVSISMFCIIRLLKKNDVKTYSQNDIEYNKKLIEYLKFLIAELCVLEFNDMNRSIKDPSKVNFNTMIRDRIEKISSNLNKQLKKDMLYQSCMDIEFYQQFIIQTIISNMTELLHRYSDREI